MVTVTLTLPDDLAAQIGADGERLSEIIAARLRQSSSAVALNAYVIDFLASDPTPEEIMAFKPAAELQKRFQELVAKSKAGGLTRDETVELDEFLKVEELIRLIKSKNLSYTRSATTDKRSAGTS